MNELYRHITRLAFLLLLLLPGGVLSAQVGSKPKLRPAPTQQDTLKKNKVDVDHADVFEYIQRKDTVFQKLNGNVELRQDSIYMYCDTAVIRNNTHVTANGKVLIQQGDSTSVFADSAMYDGVLKIAELYGDVILVNGRQKLFTDRLTYDLAQKLATYNNGATLTLDSTQLTSKRGYYYVREKQIFFKDSVIVIHPDFSLRSDTLGFNTETEVVSFLGPTLISADSSRIYTEDGYYDTENNLAAFTQNAQYQKGEQQATADTIRYDGKRSLYSLEGNARFEEGDAFDTESVAGAQPGTTIGIVSGLYELFPSNDLIRASLRGMARAVEAGGYLIYTGQPWHPQLEMIARALTSHRQGEAWVMRRRTQAEIDQLVREAGFEKVGQRIDEWGIFTASIARRTRA